MSTPALLLCLSTFSSYLFTFVLIDWVMCSFRHFVELSQLTLEVVWCIGLLTHGVASNCLCLVKTLSVHLENIILIPRPLQDTIGEWLFKLIFLDVVTYILCIFTGLKQMVITSWSLFRFLQSWRGFFKALQMLKSKLNILFAHISFYVLSLWQSQIK